MLPERSDVVVIGGGVMGAAALHYLAQLGCAAPVLVELSPDHNALVGEAPAPAGLFYATGFSGHGFQQGPVVGEHPAELALGRPPTFDLRSFSVERFAGGEARVELNVV